MATTIVLIHSPLLGPVSWRWVADQLVTHGHCVIVPSMVAGAVAGNWRTCVELAAAEAPSDDAILIGHSGAGPLLPAIAAAMPQPPTRLVFVDAALPPGAGTAALIPDEFVGHLRSLARGGVLPPWSDWFGPDVLVSLIPDDDRRRDVTADIPRVPLAFYDDRVPMPDGWSAGANGTYILLSETYRANADEARSRGWPVIERLGGHMDLVTRPIELAGAIHARA